MPSGVGFIFGGLGCLKNINAHIEHHHLVTAQTFEQSSFLPIDTYFVLYHDQLLIHDHHLFNAYYYVITVTISLLLCFHCF
jgi:hypothetical protein